MHEVWNHKFVLNYSHKCKKSEVKICCDGPSIAAIIKGNKQNFLKNKELESSASVYTSR